MKNFKLLILIIALNFICFSSLYAQNDNNQKLVFIKTFEFSHGKRQPKMIVIDNEGEVKYYDLKETNLSEFEKTFTENALIVHKEVKKWISKGYRILSYNEDTSDDEYFYSSVILVKD